MDALAAASEAIRFHAAEAGALEPVAIPPPVEDVGRLVSDIGAVRGASDQVAACEAERRALDSVSGPPQLADAETLGRDVVALKAARVANAAAASRQAALATLTETPTPADTAPLSETLTELHARAAEIADHELQLERALADGRDIAGAIRSWADDSVTCPTCGTALDADALAQHVAGAHEDAPHG